MRVLLDESLPRGLKHELEGHEVVTVPEAGWAGRKNGDLLRLAELVFDAFVTADRHLPFQQDLQGISLCIIVLSARTNTLEDLRALAPALRRVVAKAERGQLVTLSAE